MQKTMVFVDEMKIVGLSARTSNKNELNPRTAKIPETIHYYFGHNTAADIQQRKQPGKTVAVYTDYESDEHGLYTYFFGEEVTHITRLRSPLQSVIIRAGNYLKFTTPPGKMPFVAIEAWQKIWAMSPEALEGQRAYLTDFEVYDERAADPDHTVVDIYIGIK